MNLAMEDTQTTKFRGLWGSLFRDGLLLVHRSFSPLQQSNYDTKEKKLNYNFCHSIVQYLVNCYIQPLNSQHILYTYYMFLASHPDTYRSCIGGTVAEACGHGWRCHRVGWSALVGKGRNWRNSRFVENFSVCTWMLRGHFTPEMTAKIWRSCMQKAGKNPRFQMGYVRIRHRSHHFYHPV